MEIHTCIYIFSKIFNLILYTLEIHQAAKETVALAETRFLSKQHEWKFDSAWQDMLNNAILKVINNYVIINMIIKKS